MTLVRLCQRRCSRTSSETGSHQVGQPDGEQAFWIDGRLVGQWHGINWRKSPTLQANALTLESYVTDRWTKNVTNIVYFDNLVIAREYIGPAGGE